MNPPWRADFPFAHTETDIYLDSAATAHKPQAVIDALSHFYAHAYGTVHRGVYSRAVHATQAYEHARRAVQAFIHAYRAEEIIFTKGTTASINLVAQAWSAVFLHPGDIVLVSAAEHHSNLVPWQMVTAQKGAHLRFIPLTDQGELDLAAYSQLLGPRVKLVALAHMSNVLGTIHPVEKMIAAAHACGAHVCLDGAQAIAHLPVDVQALDVDFYAFSGHKLYGPTGIGILYGKYALLEQLPPLEGGGEMVDTVSLEHASYMAPPLRFEAGTPMIAEVIGLHAALTYLTRYGMEAIGAWEQALGQQLMAELADIPGLCLHGTAEHKGALASFTHPALHPLDIATLLDCQGISVRSGHLCSQPTMARFGVTSMVRASCGMYTTPQEISTFTHALKQILTRFGGKK